MQTFLPYPDFKKSASCLDYKRLGKQRVEGLQILNAIQGDTTFFVFIILGINLVAHRPI